MRNVTQIKISRIHCYSLLNRFSIFLWIIMIIPTMSQKLTFIEYISIVQNFRNPKKCRGLEKKLHDENPLSRVGFGKFYSKVPGFEWLRIFRWLATSANTYIFQNFKLVFIPTNFLGEVDSFSKKNIFSTSKRFNQYWNRTKISFQVATICQNLAQLFGIRKITILRI